MNPADVVRLRVDSPGQVPQGWTSHDELHAALRAARQAVAHGRFGGMDVYNQTGRVHAGLTHDTHLPSDDRPLAAIAREVRAREGRC